MPNVNHLAIVQRLHAEQPPEHTVESVLAFIMRVLAALPRDERAGLLRKPAGENITMFHGVMVSAGRICYPDGQLYKILTDIPTTNAPAWNDDGPVALDRYFDVSPFLGELPTPTPAPAPGPTPAPPAGPQPEPYDDELDALLGDAEKILAGMGDMRNAVVELGTKIDLLREQGIPLRLKW